MKQLLLLWDTNTTTYNDKSFAEKQQEQLQEPYGNNNSTGSSNRSNHNHRQQQNEPPLWRRKGSMEHLTTTATISSSTVIMKSLKDDFCCYKHRKTINKKDRNNYVHYFNINNYSSNNRRKAILLSVVFFLSCYTCYYIIYSIVQPTSSNQINTCAKRRMEYENNDPYIFIPDTNNINDEMDGIITTTTHEYYIPSTRSEEDDNNFDKYKIQQQQQEQDEEKQLLSRTTIRSPTLSGSSETNNRTLVILIGSLRGGEATWESLYRNVLDINTADLALIIGRHRSDDNSTTRSKEKTQYPQNSTLYNRAKYIWEYYEENDSINNFWSTAIDTMVTKDPILNQYPKAYQWRTAIMKQTLPHRGLFGGLRAKKRSWLRNNNTTSYYDLPGSGAIIFIFRIWLAEKIKLHQLQNKYYRFIITRSDHYYLCPHDLNDLLPPLPTSPSSSSSSRSLSNPSSNTKNRKEAFIWTPNGKSDFGGITDRHVVVTNRYVLDVIDILPALFKSIIHDNVVPWYRLLHWNPEEVIEYIWTHYYCYVHPSHRNTFPRTMFTVGIDGDTTRWQKYGRTVNVSEFLSVVGSVSTRNDRTTTNTRNNNNELRTVHLKYTTEYPEAIENCARLLIHNN